MPASQHWCLFRSVIPFNCLLIMLIIGVLFFRPVYRTINRTELCLNFALNGEWWGSSIVWSTFDSLGNRKNYISRVFLQGGTFSLNYISSELHTMNLHAISAETKIFQHGIYICFRNPHAAFLTFDERKIGERFSLRRLSIPFPKIIAYPWDPIPRMSYKSTQAIIPIVE